MVSGNVKSTASETWDPSLEHFKTNFVSQNRDDLSSCAPVACIVVAVGKGLNWCRVSVKLGVHWQMTYLSS